ncbi:phage tail protein [Croceicoccus estronivorus]|uniref:tail protein X n=1 Tax=Croceicoccus estronivorus TaxID=1172626 RepID=UPI00082F34D8|nr:tail protein X [Croceicoccus estronivorus]OCC25303.1 phage tail protein [Croceicoccus estronivorus]
MTATYPASALQDETLDALCWRVLGQTEKVVEQALELNPGLADQGAFLREGQQVLLPAVTRPQVPVRDLIQLWD